MATDFYVVIGKDLKRVGTRGGTPSRFYWLIDPMEIQMIDPFVVWDDFVNEYTRDEFNLVLDNVVMAEPVSNYGYDNLKVNYPDGTLDEYWSHKSTNSIYRDRYKARITGKLT